MVHVFLITIVFLQLHNAIISIKYLVSASSHALRYIDN